MSDEDWAVIRFDFNGNEVIVEKDLPEEHARALVIEFESHHHHQHYWASRLPAAPVDYTCMLQEQLKVGSPVTAALQVLRNQKASLIECIKAVRQVLGISLQESKRIVLLSPAFCDQQESHTAFVDKILAELADKT